jgi:hypothetical protein
VTTTTLTRRHGGILALNSIPTIFHHQIEEEEDNIISNRRQIRRMIKSAICLAMMIMTTMEASCKEHKLLSHLFPYRPLHQPWQACGKRFATFINRVHHWRDAWSPVSRRSCRGKFQPCDHSCRTGLWPVDAIVSAMCDGRRCSYPQFRIPDSFI